METKKPCLNVVMVPWLAHGHISPYLELAKRLSNKNFKIYLCSTPINLNSIKKRVTQKHSQSIKLIEFHLPSQPDLPNPNFHTTNGLPFHLISVLERTMNKASPSFIETIKTLKPDILIYDFNQQWASTAAASIGIPAVQFLCSSASAFCYFLHKLRRTADVDLLYPALNLRGTHWNRKIQELLKCTNDQSQSETGSTLFTNRTCDILFIKTFGEMEGKYIEYGSKLLGKKIVPTGPLAQEQEDSEDNSEIMEWLNKKDASSTVFVSFGSESFLSREETKEVAKGLELSMVNFIWVLRFSFEEEKISIEEVLPTGFLERVGDRGLVVEKWAPQARILGHPNVGGFVSHCGWGSTIEAISFGVPIVAIPMNFDQPFNARLVEEIGVGLEVNRDENGGLSGEEIAHLISEVIVGDEDGKKIRDKAREMKEKIKSKGEEDIDGVVEELYKLHKKNKIDDGDSKG